jgi:hypothetical protein
MSTQTNEVKQLGDIFERCFHPEFAVACQLPGRPKRNTIAKGFISEEQASAFIESDDCPEGTDFEIYPVAGSTVTTCTVGTVTKPFYHHDDSDILHRIESMLADAKAGNGSGATPRQKLIRRVVAAILEAASHLNDEATEDDVVASEWILSELAGDLEFIEATKAAIGLNDVQLEAE